MSNLFTSLTVVTLLGLSALTSHAATINWSSSRYVNVGSFQNTMGTGQFEQPVGWKFIYAENSGGGATVFDGISFSAGTINFGASFGTAHVNATMNPVSSTATWNSGGGANTVTLGVGGVGGVGTIVPGRSYNVQFLVMDGRLGQTGRYTEVDGLYQGVHSYYQSGVTYGDGRLVSGTFTADANFQTFSILLYTTGGSPLYGQINALVLQEIVPEPSSLSLTGLGMLGLARVVRRRRRRR